MTFKEIRDKYHQEFNVARQHYRDNVNKRLEEMGLSGTVIRVSDGKPGVLELDIDLRLRFYPLKKDGEKSKHPYVFIFDDNEDLLMKYFKKNEADNS